MRLLRAWFPIPRFATTVALILLFSACRADTPARGIVVAVDSTPDTVFVRVQGTAGLVSSTRIDLSLAPTTGEPRVMDDVGEVLVDGGGRLWLFDPQSQQLIEFDTSGVVLRRVGRGGAGPNEFGCVSGMARQPDDGIAVWDACNARIALLDSVGSERGVIRTPGSYRTYDGLKRDAEGRFYIKQPAASPAPDGGNRPVGLAEIDSTGVMGAVRLPPTLVPPPVRYVDARGGGVSARYAPRPMWGWHPDGHFVAAGGEEFRILIAARKGLPIVITRSGLPPVAISDQAREREQEGITKLLRERQPDWQWSGPALPRTKPPVEGLFIGRDGMIWVRMATPDDTTTGSLPTPLDGQLARYEVYAPDGRFVRAATIPARVRLLEADGNRLWGIMFDDEETPTIVRLRIVADSIP